MEAGFIWHQQQAVWLRPCLPVSLTAYTLPDHDEVKRYTCYVVSQDFCPLRGSIHACGQCYLVGNSQESEGFSALIVASRRLEARDIHHLAPDTTRYCFCRRFMQD